MKNLNALSIVPSLFAASLMLASPSYAGDVSTAGQAMTICKAQAEKAHPDYKRSKSTKIKQTRGVFKIKMKVITETESITTYCEVNRDGSVSYAKA